MDKVLIDRKMLGQLYGFAMYAPPSGTRNDALEAARRVLDNSQQFAPAGLTVSRPALVMLYTVACEHRDNCDIQSRAVHMEVSAAALAAKQLLGL